MTVTITDLRTTLNQFDTSDNNLDGSTGNNGTRDEITADPSPIEGGASIGIQISDTDPETIVAQSANFPIDASNSLVYGWFQVPNIASIDATDPGLALAVGDGTNIQAYGVAGDDKAGFRHDQNNTDWNCVVLDTTLAENNGSTVTYNTTANSQLTAGISENTIAQPDFTSVDRVGYFCNRVVPIKGNVANSFFDILRFGTGGLRLAADSATAISSFLDIASADRNGADGAGYGICRQVGENQFVLQGSLTFGDAAGGSAGLNFQSKNQVIFYQDIPTATVGTTSTGGGRVNVPRMRLLSSGPTGASTPTTTAITFGNRTGDGTGNQGCTLIASLEADIDFSNEEVDSVGVYGSVLRDFFNVKFRQDISAAATDHEIFQTDFIGCGRVDVGGASFKACSIFNSTATGADSAAVHIKQSDNLADLFISSGGTGHAISIDSATTGQTFTFNNFTYVGYASTTGNTGNEVLINNSGEPITINVNGGDAPTVDSDGVRGQVTIVNNATVSLTRLLGNTEISVLDNPSPYSATTLPAPDISTVTSTERISADTFVGDGTNYVRYANSGGFLVVNLAGFSNGFTNFPGVLQDTNATNPRDLAAGDKIRITIRDDADNPTLQLFDEFEVQGFPTEFTIPTTTSFSGFTSVFGTTLNSSNSKTVTIEKVDARFQFSTPVDNVIDILAFRTGSDPVLSLENTAVTGNIPLSQVGDRNYRDPA